MNKLQRWIEDELIYAGISKEEYEIIKPAIKEKNISMLTSAAWIAFLILGGLFCVTFVSPTLAHNRMLYGNLLVVLGALIFLTHIIIRPKKQFILPGCYVLLAILYGFSIVLGTVNQSENPATTFCVFLFALPLLFMDKPYRINILLIIVSVAFCMVSFRVKSFEIANMDEVNVLSFLLLSVIVNTQQQRLKMRELIQRHHIEQQRDRDELTKLMTKAAAEREVKQHLKHRKECAALMVLDIDDFKSINDKYGHAYGDAVLRIMGGCISNAFTDTDVLGRFGGDEFLVFLPRVTSKEYVVERIEALTQQMKERLVTPQESRRIHGSIGVAFAPEDATTYEELFKKADEALYASKRQGKDSYTFYFDKEIQQGEV